MHPVLFYLGQFPVPTFGVLAIAGLFLALWFQRREAVRLGYDPVKVENLILLSILSAWIGSKTFYWAQNPGRPLAEVLLTGYVFYGGVIVSVPCAIYIAHRSGIPGLRLVDIVTPGMTLGLVLGRLGCLAVGCDYGCVAEPAWYTLTFNHPLTAVPPELRGLSLLPSQPLMAIALLLTFAVIYPLRKRLTPWPGAVLLLYFVVEPPTRFLIEMTRGDSDRGFVGPLSTSQAIAVGLFLLGSVGLYWRTRQPGTPCPSDLAPIDKPGSEKYTTDLQSRPKARVRP